MRTKTRNEATIIIASITLTLFLHQIKSNNNRYRVFKPDSVFKRSWDLIGMVATVFYGIKIPFMIAWGFEPTVSSHILDGLAFLFFLLDIYMHYMHFAVLTEGRVETKRENFRPIYLKNKLGFDVFSTLPIYFVVILIVGEGNGGWVWLCALNNFCRVRRFTM